MMKKKDLLICIIKGIGIILAFGYFFYRSYIITLFLIPSIYPYLVFKAKEHDKARKNALLLQFKDMLGTVNSSMQAGYSIENAFLEAGKDMGRLYGSDADIVKELCIIRNGLINNYSLTGLIKDFSKRSGLEEIESFASILHTGVRTGGNMGKIMNSYIRVIEEKTGVIQEIETMVSARRFEQKIMNIIPFFIIFYVDLTNKGFFGILYHNLFGNLVMTITMGIYVLSVYLSEKMIDIAV